MSLQCFSKSLFALYEAAEQCEPEEFSAEVVRIAGNLIQFDGAVLGAGRVDPAPEAGLLVDRAYIHNRSPSLLTDYAAVSTLDPIIKSFAHGLSQPLAEDCEARYRQRGLEQLREFARRHELGKLLLYGDAPGSEGDAKWLVLYRRAGEDFSGADALLLHFFWSHAARTLKMNIQLALNRIDPHHLTRALAFVNSRGVLEMANPAMMDMLKLEWPMFNARNLPISVISLLIGNGRYRGRKIEITAFQKFGYMACTARRVPAIDMLAPSELNVADRFAKGLTHSQIALQLKISPHTVRNQLANVYQKLGIHSKVDLVRAMSSRQSR